MAIKAQFTKNDVRKRFDDFLKEVERAQIEALERLGEQCVTHARDIPADVGFADRTGNLRSSIGYVIFKDGQAIRQNYEQVLEANEGIQAGQRLAEEVGSNTKGICLVVTAGMNYATYVEAKGRDVLASAETLAQRELPKVLQDLIDDVKLAAR